MERIEAETARSRCASAPRRLAVLPAEAAFVLQLPEAEVARLIETGSLVSSGLHASTRVIVSSLAALMLTRIDEKLQSALGRWVLQQIVEGKLRAPHAASPTEHPPALIDAVGPVTHRPGSVVTDPFNPMLNSQFSYYGEETDDG